MRKPAYLSIIILILICICGCAVLNHKDADQNLYKDFIGSCKKEIKSTTEETLGSITSEIDELFEEESEKPSDKWLDSSVVGIWRIEDETNQNFCLLDLKKDGSGHISGYKGEWYITKRKLHIAIPISDTAISVNADTFEYSVNGNTLYLDGKAYTRITETPDRSSAASSLVGTWVIDGSASDEYPTELKLKKDGTGKVGDDALNGCFWCIDEDMLYYETQRFEYCFFTYRMEGKTLYLDDVAYTKR